MREPEPLPDFVPSELKKIIAKSLAKFPENRYKTAGEMRNALERIIMLFRNATFTPTEKIIKEIPEKTESFTKPLTEEILTEEITEFEKPQNEVISFRNKIYSENYRI